MRAAVAGLLLALAAAAPAAVPATDPLPGAPSRDAALAARLAAALAAKGPDYRPRTHHLRSDGAPRYTNRLILESSPYLLQHAHNPVDWYPWGEEAFSRAVAEAKPVLLSVGYSTCHWCHVMEEESFENEEIARYLNENYVAIKVDRELRPDVDETYMHAVQLLTGGGGWPMTVWLTPLREPFAGGTYFPPPQFLAVLRRLRADFDADPLRIAGQAATLTGRVRRLSALPAGEGLPGPALLHRAFDGYRETFDREHGGFGGAPKFPAPPELDFLLRYARHAGRPEARDMVTLTLARMAAGGIHDQVGGGFHRYATDAAWQIPHFEKMLYDNADLALVYLAAWQATGRGDHAVVVRDILDYVAREMTAPGGAFYSATDADSEGEEGRFFVWTPGEVRAALDPAHAEAVVTHYGVTAAGNFHGKNVLHVAAPADPLLVDEARPRLYAARRRRVAPHRDEKILAGWNGLMISAFARGGAALGVPAYVGRARAAARFVVRRMRVDGRLHRSWSDGQAREDACLDDYAYLAAGLLDLYEATFELRWLAAARDLARVLEQDFVDADQGGFFLTAADRDTPLGREKPFVDGALPSGNAVAALALYRLGELTADDRHRAAADGVLRAFAPRLEAAPAAAPALLAALDCRLDRAKEVVIVRPGDAAEDGPLLAAVRRAYLPDAVVTTAVEGADLGRRRMLVPLVADKQALRGQPTAYVCERGVCALPTADPAVLARQLGEVAPLAAP